MRQEVMATIPARRNELFTEPPLVLRNQLFPALLELLSRQGTLGISPP
jgi:hypothetical protein